MVADLVHQDVGDDGTKRLVVLGPVVQDRSPLEPHHVGHLRRRAFRAERQADALEQPEQVKLGLGAELVEHLVGREILDPDHQALAQRAELFGQSLKGGLGKHLELDQGRRLDRVPCQRIGKSGIGHGGSFRRPGETGQDVAGYKTLQAKRSLTTTLR